MKKKKSPTKYLTAAVFLTPYLYFFINYLLYPIFRGFYISLHKWKLTGKVKFVGFENYVKLLNDETFFISIRNVIFFVLISTPVLIVLGLFLAMIVNSKIKGRTILRSGYFMPYVLSVSVVASLWIYILQPYTGLLSAFLKKIGYAGEIFWLTTEIPAWISILAATVWWTVGFNMILFLSGLQDVNEDLYEAASIDGAGPIVKFFNITIPSLRGTFVTVILLQTIASFKLFGQSYLITNGGPGNSTRTIIQYIYETSITKNNLGKGSAMSYVFLGLMVIVSIIQLKITREKKVSK